MFSRVLRRNGNTLFRRNLSKEVFTHPHKYLLSVGFSELQSESILKAFGAMGQPATVRSLESFGVPGLQSFAASVEREESKKNSKRDGIDASEAAIPINVHVSFPGGPNRDAPSLTVSALVGDSLLDIIEATPSLQGYLECACGGIAACSTCHIIVDPEHFPLLPPIEEDEEDMLDLAWGNTATSRLGCQVRLSRGLDGLKITIPDGSINLYSR